VSLPVCTTQGQSLSSLVLFIIIRLVCINRLEEPVSFSLWSLKQLQLIDRLFWFVVNLDCPRAAVGLLILKPR
jgi:hypothetical protein